MDSSLSFLVKVISALKINLSHSKYNIAILILVLSPAGSISQIKAEPTSSAPTFMEMASATTNMDIKSLLQRLSAFSEKRDFFCAYTRKEVDSCANAHSLAVFA